MILVSSPYTQNMYVLHMRVLTHKHMTTQTLSKTREERKVRVLLVKRLEFEFPLRFLHQLKAAFDAICTTTNARLPEDHRDPLGSFLVNQAGAHCAARTFTAQRPSLTVDCNATWRPRREPENQSV